MTKAKKKQMTNPIDDAGSLLSSQLDTLEELPGRSGGNPEEEAAAECSQKAKKATLKEA